MRTGSHGSRYTVLTLRSPTASPQGVHYRSAVYRVTADGLVRR